MSWSRPLAAAIRDLTSKTRERRQCDALISHAQNSISELDHLADPAARALAKAALERRSTLFTLTSATLVGGYEYRSLVAGMAYDLYFAQDEVLVTATGRPDILLDVPYGEVLAMRVDGPGAIRRGGGTVPIYTLGAGFAANAELFIVTSLVNALTSRTKIYTFFELQDRVGDLIFFHEGATPQQLQLRLMPVKAKLRHANQHARDESSAPVDPLDRLDKLATLRAQGALTEDEYLVAKQKLLQDL